MSKDIEIIELKIPLKLHNIMNSIWDIGDDIPNFVKYLIQIADKNILRFSELIDFLIVKSKDFKDSESKRQIGEYTQQFKVLRGEFKDFKVSLPSLLEILTKFENDKNKIGKIGDLVIPKELFKLIDQCPKSLSTSFGNHWWHWPSKNILEHVQNSLRYFITDQTQYLRRFSGVDAEKSLEKFISDSLVNYIELRSAKINQLLHVENSQGNNSNRRNEELKNEKSRLIMLKLELLKFNREIHVIGERTFGWHISVNTLSELIGKVVYKGEIEEVRYTKIKDKLETIANKKLGELDFALNIYNDFNPEYKASSTINHHRRRQL